MAAKHPHVASRPMWLRLALAVAVLSASCSSDDSSNPASTATDPSISAPDETAPRLTAASETTTIPSVADGAADDTDAQDAAATTTVAVDELQVRGLLTDQHISIDGIEREYHVFLPDEPDGAPVVLLFHGNSSNSDELLGVSDNASPYRVWLDIADRENVIVVAPSGLSTSETEQGWNDCRSDAPTNSTADDVAFVSELIDTIVDNYGADAERVYASGTSNGGHLAIRLAEELPQKIAAFASIAAANAINSECVTSTLPVSAMFINGTADSLLPYDGGAMINGAQVFSVDDTVASWVARNGADDTAEVDERADLDDSDGSTISTRIHRDGIDGTEVALITVNGGGHIEPSIQERIAGPIINVIGPQNADIEMATEVWAFFEGKRRVSIGGDDSAHPTEPPHSNTDSLVVPAVERTQVLLPPADLRDYRYCEVIPVFLADTTARAEVFNTMGMNDCPDSLWQDLDAQELAEQLGAQAVILNGPRHWVFNSLTGSGDSAAGQTSEFAGLQMGLRAILERPLDGSPIASAPYSDITVTRTTVFTYNGGNRVYELTSPTGDVYRMQSYSQIVDPSLVIGDLESLGQQLALPAGWSYDTRIIDTDESLTADGVAVVITDNLSNTYQLVG